MAVRKRFGQSEITGVRGMFFKTNRDENTDPELNVRRRQRTKATLVGEGIRLVGDLEGDGEIQILGVVEGSVTCSRLVISAGGLVKGEVTANEAEVNGDFQGRMEVRLLVGGPTGSLVGELKYKEMSISTGCLIAGHLEQTPSEKGSSGNPKSAKKTGVN